MEVTMQWWDNLDDLWFAAGMKLSAWHFRAAPLARASVVVCALALTVGI
ncbi:MAG: hypothetical protein AAFO81_12835 [Pseudomonadota bacterium]